MRTTEFRITTAARKLVREIDSIEKAAVICNRQALRNRLDEGDKLRELKDSVEHGQWLPLLAKLHISERRAQHYMRLARHRVLVLAKSDSESDFGLTDALEFIREQAATDEDDEEQTGAFVAQKKHQVVAHATDQTDEEAFACLSSNEPSPPPKLTYEAALRATNIRLVPEMPPPPNRHALEQEIINLISDKEAAAEQIAAKSEPVNAPRPDEEQQPRLTPEAEAEAEAAREADRIVEHALAVQAEQERRRGPEPQAEPESEQIKKVEQIVQACYKYSQQSFVDEIRYFTEHYCDQVQSRRRNLFEGEAAANLAEIIRECADKLLTLAQELETKPADEEMAAA
jgi:hypothetical protein